MMAAAVVINPRSQKRKETMRWNFAILGSPHLVDCRGLYHDAQTVAIRKQFQTGGVTNFWGLSVSVGMRP